MGTSSYLKNSTRARGRSIDPKDCNLELVASFCRGGPQLAPQSGPERWWTLLAAPRSPACASREVGRRVPASMNSNMSRARSSRLISSAFSGES
jgi:hypothetical protein